MTNKPQNDDTMPYEIWENPMEGGEHEIQTALDWFNEVLGLMRQCMIEKTKDMDLDDEDLSAIKAIRAALQNQLKAVKVEDLRKPVLAGSAPSMARSEKVGWNACLDHLKEQGII